VIYGRSSSAEIGLGLDAAGGIDASQGFRINKAVTDISNAGDINGDGLTDLILGDGNIDNYTGTYHLILGGTTTVTSAVNGTGTSASEAVLGTAGNDTLTGGGGVDRFFAGKGNDTIVLAASDVSNLSATTGTTRASIDGGTGYDTLRVSASGVNLNLTNITNVGAMGLEENSRIESIERIDLGSDSTANTLTIAARDVNDMAGFNQIRLGLSADGNTWTNVSGNALSATTQFHQVVVDGSNNDSVTLAAGNGFWTNAGTVSNGASQFTVWQNSGTSSQVIVKNGVMVTNNDASALGDSVINLGSSGNLIAPVQVEGKWYYYWDRSGDGTNASTGSLNGGLDYTTFNSLKSIFNKDINGNANPAGNVIDETYRYALINGVLTAIPTANGGQALVNTSQEGTAASGSGTLNNSHFDELLAIWDAFNGTSTSTNIAGMPIGWVNGNYWSATASANGRVNVGLFNGSQSDTLESNVQYLALEVVRTNAAPVLNASASPTLSSVYANTSPTNGQVVGDLVSTLVGGHHRRCHRLHRLVQPERRHQLGLCGRRQLEQQQCFALGR
jgi:hypothetical protein